MSTLLLSKSVQFECFSTKPGNPDDRRRAVEQKRNMLLEFTHFYMQPICVLIVFETIQIIQIYKFQHKYYHKVPQNMT